MLWRLLGLRVWATQQNHVSLYSRCKKDWRMRFFTAILLCYMLLFKINLWCYGKLEWLLTEVFSTHEISVVFLPCEILVFYSSTPDHHFHLLLLSECVVDLSNIPGRRWFGLSFNAHALAGSVLDLCWKPFSFALNKPIVSLCSNSYDQVMTTVCNWLFFRG